MIPAKELVVEDHGVRFDGELYLVRFSAAKQPERLLFCRGKALRLGRLALAVKDAEASFEIDLTQPDAPVVIGPARALESLEIAGRRVWPK